MFGGYHGQDGDKQKIIDLKAELVNDPNNLDLKRKLEDKKRYHKEKMDSALRSYSRI